MQVNMSGAKDIVHRQPIVVCPFDHNFCRDEMSSIEASAREAATIHPEHPPISPPVVVFAQQPGGLRALGVAMVEGRRKPLID